MTVKTLDAIKSRIREIDFLEHFDLIVAVARGGVIPATMVQARLGGELQWIWINFRNDDQSPARPEPALVRPLDFECRGRTILLVDDRAKTGGSLAKARDLLLAAGAATVKTCVVNGKSDYSLFDEDCFYFPWRLDIE